MKLPQVTLKHSINSACLWWFYQPKLPSGIEKFKK
ncbi:cyclic lactone autoinducer peptide [Anaeromicropila populeti]